MRTWEELTKRLEKACREEIMIGVVFHGPLFGYMEYYFYIDEMDVQENELNIHSGNFEMTLYNKEGIRSTEEGYQIIDNGNEMDLMLVA